MSQSLSELGLTVIPDFITMEEESEILSHIHPSKRKLSNSGRNKIARYGSKVPYNSNIASNSIPEFLDALSERLVSSGYLDVKPDSVTINEYLKGQTISAHIDVENSGPVITVLGLLSPAVMVFTKKKHSIPFDFPNRCIIQMRDEIRYKWNHAIEPVLAPRCSIVFRKATLWFLAYALNVGICYVSAKNEEDGNFVGFDYLTEAKCDLMYLVAKIGIRA